MKKALFTEEFHPLLAMGLSGLGIECVQKWDYSSEAVKHHIHEYEILIINSKIKVDRELLEKALKLKVILRIGSGLEILDLKACKDLGIQVIATPEGNANAVAEHTLAFILSAFNHLQRAQNEMMNDIWSRESNRGEELCKKVLAVIGCGNNGSRLIQLLSGFDTEVLVYDLVDVSSRINNARARQVEMQEIFQRADIVSFHIPLNAETYQLISLEFIKKFNKTIDIVNTSRGGICHFHDLVLALNQGYVRRAMMDVYDNEPFRLDEATKCLVRKEQLYVSPHIAGWTFESKKRMAEIAIEKLKSTGLF